MASETSNDAANVGPWSGSAPSTWALDTMHSSFTFRVKHFWGLVTVSGHFTQFEGEAQVDAAGAVMATVRIQATSLETKQKQRDKHLRSADFFTVEKHPTVTFATRQVTPLGADRLKVEGELAAAGRGQPLTFEARYSAAADRVVVDAEVHVDRTAFGMTWSPLRMASPTATLVVHAQFNKRGA